jgi:hypothetical protein
VWTLAQRRPIASRMILRTALTVGAVVHRNAPLWPALVSCVGLWNSCSRQLRHSPECAPKGRGFKRDHGPTCAAAQRDTWQEAPSVKVRPGRGLSEPIHVAVPPVQRGAVGSCIRRRNRVDFRDGGHAALRCAIRAHAIGPYGDNRAPVAGVYAQEVLYPLRPRAPPAAESASFVRPPRTNPKARI